MRGLACAMLCAGLLVGLPSCARLDQLRRFFFTACPASGPEPAEEFEIRIPPLDLESYEAGLHADPEARQIATVAYEGVDRAILALRIVGRRAERRALVVAGVHGNELAGVLAVPRLLDRARAGGDPWDRFELVVVTPANPVGAAHGSRYNGSGCDVNRDFARFEGPEARALRDAVDDLRPELIVSLHEGPQQGFFLIATAAASAEVGEAAVAALEAGGFELAERSFLGLRLGRPGLAAESTFTKWLKRAIRLHSLGAWATRRGIGTYTTESPWSSPDFEARIESHVVATEAILRATR